MPFINQGVKQLNLGKRNVEPKTKHQQEKWFFHKQKKSRSKKERLKYTFKSYVNCYFATLALHIFTAAVTSITAPVVESVPKSTVCSAPGLATIDPL